MNPAFISREKTFLAACAVVFAASGAGTIYLCKSMSGGMEMPGGWTMSMAWMRMPRQSWLGPAAMFIAMWVVMMVAMMLPSLVPALFNYSRLLRRTEGVNSGALAALAGGTYFLAWAVVGVGAYAVGTLVTTAEMRSVSITSHVPIATAVVLVLAGCFQLTGWKKRLLARCRDEQACSPQVKAGVGGACLQGIRWGIDCTLCCAGYMAVLLVTGVMNLMVMAILAIAIATERITSFPQRTARITGVLLIVTGAFMIAGVLRA